MDPILVTKSEGVGLIVRAISFQDFQPMWSQITNVTDGRTTCDPKTARKNDQTQTKLIKKINIRNCYKCKNQEICLEYLLNNTHCLKRATKSSVMNQPNYNVFWYILTYNLSRLLAIKYMQNLPNHRKTSNTSRVSNRSRVPITNRGYWSLVLIEAGSRIQAGCPVQTEAVGCPSGANLRH